MELLQGSYFPIIAIAVLVVCCSMIIVNIVRDRRALKESEFFAVQRTAQLLEYYRQCGAAEIIVRISPETSEIASRVAITMRGPRGLLQDSGEPTKLLDSWTTWPAWQVHNGPNQEAMAIDIQNAEVLFGVPNTDDREPMSPKVHLTPTRTAVELEELPAKWKSRPIQINFETTNVFMSLFELPPYGRQRMILFVEQFLGYSHIILHVEFPDKIALRGRWDNAEFYSHSVGLDDHYQRNTAFIPGSALQMRYTFGTDEASVLSSPLFPITSAAFALLIVGYSIDLLWQQPTVDVRYLAGLALILASFGSFTEIIRTRRVFFSGAVTGHKSLLGLVSTLLMSLQIIIGIAIAVAYFWRHDLRDQVKWLAVALGSGLAVFGVGFGLALALGAPQQYICDRCERWIWNRMSVKPSFHPKRRTLHKKCAREEEREEQAAVAQCQ